MITYGNQIWNTSIGNDEKSVIPMKKEAFDNLKTLLDNAGLNYYAYEKNNAVVMGVNTKDIDWLKRLVGNPAADKMNIQKAKKPYTPPSKNIIGNTEYRFIPNKSYFSADSDTALKIAEMLTDTGVAFSGRIYSSGKATLTISENDLDRVKEINNQVISMRKSFAYIPKKAEHEIIGNTPYRNIQQKYFHFSNISNKEYDRIKPILENQNISFSGLVRNDNVMFTVEESKVQDFFKSLNFAINKADILTELKTNGFSEKQITQLEPVIDLTAEMERYGMIERFVNPRYSDDDISKMSKLISQYLNASDIERLTDKDKVFTNMATAKSEIDTRIALNELYTEHNFNSEQKDEIKKAFTSGVSIELLSQLDETYSKSDINEFSELYHTYDYNKISAFIENHNSQSQVTQSDIVSSILSFGESQAKIDMVKNTYDSDIFMLPTKGEDVISAIKKVNYSDERLTLSELADKLNENADKFELSKLSSIECDIVSNRGETNTFHLSPENLFRIHNNTVNNETSYTLAKNNIEIRGKEIENANSILREYFTGKRDFAEVLDMAVAGDELEEISRQIIGATPEAKAEIAKQYTKSNTTFVFHVNNDSSKIFGDTGIPFEISMEQTSDGLKFTHDNDCVTYNYDFIGECFERAVRKYNDKDVTTAIADIEPLKLPDKNTFDIYQLKKDSQNQKLTFLTYNVIAEEGITLTNENYDKIYSGTLAENTSLDDIFTDFNVNRPEDFTGHSLSVSDVIVTNRDGEISADFVNSVGFVSLENFFPELEMQHSKEGIQSNISESQKNANPMNVHSEKTERPQKPENEPLQTDISHSDYEDEKARTDYINNISITCDWSESSVFEEGRNYSVSAFDSIMKQADDERIKERKECLANHNNSMEEWLQADPESYYRLLGYEKTKFTLNMPDGTTHSERQDIGDGCGGVIDFLSQYPEYDKIVPLLKEACELQPLESKLTNNYRFQVQNIYQYEVTHNVPEEERLTRWYDEESVSVAKPTYIKDGSEINISEDTINTRFHQLQEVNNEKDTPEISSPTISEEFEKAGITEESPFIVSPEVEAELAEKRITETNNDKPDENFRITDDNLGEGGAKTKFKANAAAITTLKKIENEDRKATAEEKNILSQYVGWGSLQQAFDPDNKSWNNEYNQLKELLTDSEYRSASASTLDAFYTAPVIIDGIYSAMKQFGFEGGNVLEPALGVGNFLGRMPEEMSKNSKIYGTEIDSISGRIAQQLYPNADIKVQGFEKNEYQNDCFDIAVGNVPFGDLGFTDKKHGTNKLHDFFFTETLDKVKEGGIVAFVTSTGTLDKKDSNIRKMLSDKADLVGAIRLPSGAFKANAGTEVTSDIIFLQKRSIPPLIEPDWVQLGKTDDGLPVNKYYENNPEMVLGKIVEGNKLYGRNDDTMCIPFEGADIGVQLQDAVKKLNATISDERAEPVYPAKENAHTDIPADLRNYSFFEREDKILFKKTDTICDFRCDKKNSTHKRIKAFIELRDCTRDLLTAQEQDKPDSEITALQHKLNVLYDSFNKDFGLLHSRNNKNLLREDISYSLVVALEKKIENNRLVEKSDLFTKRTIKPAKAVSHVDTAIEALALSIAEKTKVDLSYMEALTDLPQEVLIDELHGEIFPVPGTDNEYQSASEYLSGDIRVKLNEAEAALKDDSRMQGNIEALKVALPEPLKAADIDVKLGATWVDKSIYQQFIYDTFNTPELYREDGRKSFWRKPKNITVDYSEHTGSWRIENKSADSSVVSTKKFGTNRINAYQIMEDILNLKEPKLYKSSMVNGEEKRVIDIEATKLAQRKAEKIKTAFKDWVFEDPDRRATLVDKYNSLFNSIKPREYDGSNLRFPGMNSDIHLHEHQKNAIAHSLFGGNTLFAHSVGAGKTFEMIASAMESKRLGLCTKSLFAVPNHLTEQIGDDFRKLYPNSNVLVATKTDFKKENRQALFSKIAAGNFDAVIIGHSQLSMLKMSKERQENILNSQIDDIMEGIKELKKDEGSKFQVKAMERTKKSLVKRLENLKKDKQDDIITFEQLGVDKLFVDEAHEFKNLFTPTKLQNVSGISSSASQKALDLFMKCQYLDEKTGGKGIVFATGTPLSNSVTELHTMMRYLEYDFLKSKNLQHFDNWVTVFGNQKTDWELAPAGNKFKQRTRIANYTGLPELISMFKQCADVRTADTLNLDVPNCEMHIVNVEATPFQKTLVEELAERADDVQDRNVEPEVDNMLRITSDGRKLGLDPRLINPDFEDDPNTKLNQCVKNVFKIYEDTSSDKSTQIIFCDLGVPHGTNKAASQVNENGETIEDDKSVSEKESLEEECDFCVYNDIKAKLMENGVPEEQIAFIHSAKTEKAKTELFEKVRSGDVRVLLGSTGKMGTGTNVQDKLIAVHDLDIPWRPADMEQRKGRIVRQGNKNKNVHVFRYVTKGTFDAYSYQTLENKQKFISQIMTSKVPLRKCDDVDQQALSYSEIKALCTGDERIKEKMSLDNEVKELKMLKAEYKNTQYEMQDKVKNFPAYNERCERIIKNLTSDLEHCKQLPIDPETNLPKFSIEIEGTNYTDRTEAAKALETACLNLISKSDEPVTIGKLHGFPLTVSYSSFEQGIKATLHGAAQHKSDFSISFANNIKKLENSVFKIGNNIDDVKTDLHRQELDVVEAKNILKQPFAQEAELESKEKRLVELTEELNEAAAQAKLNNPGKQRTCYFEMAKLKKDSLKRSNPQKKTPSKDKSTHKSEEEIA